MLGVSAVSRPNKSTYRGLKCHDFGLAVLEMLKTYLKHLCLRGQSQSRARSLCSDPTAVHHTKTCVKSCCVPFCIESLGSTPEGQDSETPKQNIEARWKARTRVKFPWLLPKLTRTSCCALGERLVRSTSALPSCVNRSRNEGTLAMRVATSCRQHVFVSEQVRVNVSAQSNQPD